MHPQCLSLHLVLLWLSQLNRKTSIFFRYFRGELDRFAETLIKIREEAYSMPEIVKNAPYTAAEIAS